MVQKRKIMPVRGMNTNLRASDLVNNHGSCIDILLLSVESSNFINNT